MGNFFRKIRKQNGVSTIEMLIAFTIVILSITAVIAVVFGSQALAIDSETNHEAQLLAQGDLEEARALSREDFLSLNSTPTTTVSSGGLVYIKSRTVMDISPCAKQVTSSINWMNEARNQLVNLYSTFTSPEEAIRLAGHCDPYIPTGGWDTPTSLGTLSSSEINGQATGVAIASTEDADYAFLSVWHSDPSKDDFFPIDVTDRENPDLLSGASLNTGNGLNGVVIFGDYAFAIQNHTTDHLQVIDISVPNNPDLIESATRTLPNMTTGIPRSIFYYDKKIYIGTQYLPCPSCPPQQNNEFHIYDVSDPENPTWFGSIDVNRNVNAIIVRNGIAFLATGPGDAGTKNPLKIYDIDPSSPSYKQQIGSFIATQTNNQAGTSIFLLGNKLYLGLERATGANKDFYILDVSNPAAPQEFAPGSAVKLELQGSNSFVSALVVQGPLAFLGITNTNPQESSLQILNISNPSSPRRINVCTSGDPIPKDVSVLIFFDNLIFASFRSNEAFRIIYDDPDLACS